MRSYIGFFRNAGLLYLLWWLLSGRSETWLLGLGLISSVAIAWLHARQPGPPSATIPFYRFMSYLPWLFYRILMSNLHVVYLILHPRLPIDPRLIDYQTRLRDPAAITLLANSITLTPGTITAEVEPGSLTVHALDGSSSRDLMSGRLEEKIDRVFEKKGER